MEYISRNRLWETIGDIEFFTDTVASIGIGIYVKGKWAQAKWGHAFSQEVQGMISHSWNFYSSDLLWKCW
jgi:hypothetical protein